MAQASIALERAGQSNVELNEPYSARDGVTYTLAKHAEVRGLQNMMIEVRNDLIETPAKAQAVADRLAVTLRGARAEIQS